MTPKQERFVREYLIDLNATQAAIRCGYSAKTANREGARLLSNAVIKAAIDAAKIKRTDKLEISGERVLKEISRMAFYDPLDLIEIVRDALPDEIADDVRLSDDGKVIQGLRSAQDIKYLPEDVRRAIVGWGYDRNQNFTLKLADKSKALDQLARHLSLYNDKLEVTGLDALADRLARAAKRAGD
ncbi:terminase small subunit [Mesorhizobium sp. VK22B]|uniref:Terminase small subunit n=1 Tax=Mesorhizobium captivum TaxID=3072319 RepID=A0ABU4Z1G9_9HYPH|nr:terminase small subunit [Mesorhizobium sp. VK22B]MDX8492903.1 terminase small subunit [Mesorhizobium sp. VK22B]